LLNSPRGLWNRAISDDLEGRSRVVNLQFAKLFKCNSSNVCAEFCKISIGTAIAELFVGMIVSVVVSSSQIVRLYSRFTSLDKSSNGYLR